MDQITLHRKNLFFWSDTHFWHARAAGWRGCGTNVEAMNEQLIELANRMPVGSTLVLLGDVSFAGSTRTLDVLRRIKARKILVRGNHDKAMNNVVLAEFDLVSSLLTVKVMGDPQEDSALPLLARIVCCHFPMLSWDMQHYGAWHLHGHSHGNMVYPWQDARIMDVGVDVDTGAHNGVHMRGPYSFDSIAAWMEERQTRSSDHHQPKEVP